MEKRKLETTNTQVNTTKDKGNFTVLEKEKKQIQEKNDITLDKKKLREICDIERRMWERSNGSYPFDAYKRNIYSSTDLVF